MKRGLTYSLLLAAALAAAPALAQRTVSGTIAGSHAATAAAASAAPQAAAPASDTPAAVEADNAANAPAASAPPVAAAPAAPQRALDMTIPPAAQPPASTSGGLLQTSLALLFVIALMLGLAWLTKRFAPKSFGAGNSNVKLVGALSVGARERILVVEVGEQWIVVGASPGRMNALATMPRQESTEQAVPAALPSANFAAWFKQTIEKRNGQ